MKFGLLLEQLDPAREKRRKAVFGWAAFVDKRFVPTDYRVRLAARAKGWMAGTTRLTDAELARLDSELGKAGFSF